MSDKLYDAFGDALSTTIYSGDILTELLTGAQKTIDKTIDKSVDKVETNYRQTIDRPKKKKKNKTIDKPKVETKYRQTSDTTIDESIDKTIDETIDESIDKFSFNEVTGIQRTVLVYVFNSCLKELSFTSEKISIENLCKAAKTSPFSVKKSVLRLRDKGLLSKGEYKNGRGGWTRYIISKAVYQEMNYLKQNGLLTIDESIDETVDKSVDETVDKLVTQLETSPSSSSSNINIYKNTTTSSPELPDNWLSIDYSEIEGFSKTHLMQLFRHGGFDSDSIQESIDAFVFDLSLNKKEKTIRGDKIAFFLGIMKRQGVYSPPANYESPKLRAARLWQEAKNHELDELKKIEDEGFETSFELWMRQSSREEKIKLIGDGGEFFMQSENSKGTIHALKKAYRETKWLLQ